MACLSMLLVFLCIRYEARKIWVPLELARRRQAEALLAEEKDQAQPTKIDKDPFAAAPGKKGANYSIKLGATFSRLKRQNHKAF